MKTKWMAVAALSLGLCGQAIAQGTGTNGGRTNDADDRTPTTGTRSGGESSDDASDGTMDDESSPGVHSSTSTEVHRSTSTEVHRSTSGARGSDPRGTGTGDSAEPKRQSP